MKILLTLLLASRLICDAALPNLRQMPSVAVSNAPALSSPLANGAGEPIRTRPEWDHRHAELLQAWTHFLGGFPSDKVALEPEFSQKEPAPGYTRQKVTYAIEEGLRIDAMLLIPTNRSGKLPGIVLFHPTYSNHYARVIGLEDKDNPERHQAVQLVQRGYVVLAPRCFIYADLPPGELKPGAAPYPANVRRMRDRHPNWRGMTRMTWDGIRALDFLSTLPELDSQRLGILGHSLGAKEVLYVAAFDPRVKCTVFSEGGIGLGFSNWQDAWYLGPDIKQPGFKLDHHELLALIAPRPFLLLAGDSADGDRSWAYINAAAPVYALLDAGQNLGWLNHHLGHRYGAQARSVAEEFLDRHLKP